MIDRLADTEWSSHRESIRGHLGAGRWIPDSIDSELIAAALLRSWCKGIRFIPRSDEQGERTPDLEASFGNTRLEIEVTRARPKEDQARRTEVAFELDRSLQTLNVGRRIEVFYLEPLQVDDRAALIKAVIELGQQGEFDCTGKWLVRVGRAPEEPWKAPSWWPELYAIPVVIGMTTRLPPSQAAAAGPIEVHRSLGTTNYLGPLQGKAKRSQGSRERPLLVALHATGLPGARGWYDDNLLEHLSQWPNVSGVLVFDMYNSITSVLLEYSLFRNSKADVPLPKRFFDLVGERTSQDWPLY